MTPEQPKRDATPIHSMHFASAQDNRTLYGKNITNFFSKTSENQSLVNITENLNRTYNCSTEAFESHNESASIFAEYPQELLYFGAICCIVFAIVGAIGNLTSVFALCMSKKIKNATTAFIVNLCVADFLFCSFSMPLTALTFIEKDWKYGKTLCVLFPLVRYSNGVLSLFSVIAITVNCYILIGHPRIYDSVYTKRKVAIMICLMWMFSPVFLLPPALGVWGKLDYNPAVGTCTILEVNGKSPKTFFFVAAFVLPSAVFVVCYLKIYYIVKKGSKKTRRAGDKLPLSVISQNKGYINKSFLHTGMKSYLMQQRHKKELKVLQVMLVVFILYILCYFPALFVKMFRKECDLPVLNVLGYLGVYFSNIVNPLIYIVMSDVYRKAYKELFCRGTAKDVIYNSSSIRPRIV